MAVKLKTIIENEWEEFTLLLDSDELKREAVHDNIRKILQLLERALPCDHQHLIFALALELRELAKSNRRAIFNLMTRTIWATIRQFINRHMNYQPAGLS